MIKTKDNTVSILVLRALLYQLKDLRPDICVRFRFIGDMWQTHHYRITQLTEKGVLLKDERANRLLFVPDLSTVMQFELDHGFQHFQPHFHYYVNPAD